MYLTKCILQRSVQRAQTGFNGLKTRGRIQRQRLRTFWFLEILEELKNYQLIKKDFAVWSPIATTFIR